EKLGLSFNFTLLISFSHLFSFFFPFPSNLLLGCRVMDAQVSPSLEVLLLSHCYWFPRVFVCF
ncbi:hypothetical protein Godav_015174, partial [Gossypium davidsonii]|nr:hypothetical protein [Gossypium davidsonii]